VIEKRFCLITGASRGLGKVLAERFWNWNWSLVLIARGRPALTEVIESLGARPGQSVHMIVADLTHEEEIRELEPAIKSLVPRLDVVINNAGIQGAIGPAWENDWAEWLETLRMNLLAPVGISRLVIPWMIASGGGSIINLSGGGATAPRANFSAYATAKAGLVRFSETLAEELKPHNVRVNCVAPGAMRTSMLQDIVDKGTDAVGDKEYNLARRVMAEGGASMDVVAELCNFLASDAARGITGKLISAVWDDWRNWTDHIEELSASDVYTLRRIVGRDRGFGWGDK
jgi:NAD(P)-dependent dehydrogenase (short-subunit alcohol dehydrogenase family)